MKKKPPSYSPLQNLPSPPFSSNGPASSNFPDYSQWKTAAARGSAQWGQKPHTGVAGQRGGETRQATHLLPSSAQKWSLRAITPQEKTRPGPLLPVSHQTVSHPPPPGPATCPTILSEGHHTVRLPGTSPLGQSRAKYNTFRRKPFQSPAKPNSPDTPHPASVENIGYFPGKLGPSS